MMSQSHRPAHSRSLSAWFSPLACILLVSMLHAPADAQSTSSTLPTTQAAAPTASVEGLLVSWREIDRSEGETVTEVLGLMTPGHMRLNGHTVQRDSGGEAAGVDNLSLIFLADPDRFFVIQKQSGEVTEIRSRMIELAEATLEQQMDESEVMASQLEAQRQAEILSRIATYRHYLTSYDQVFTRELPETDSVGGESCRLVVLERERLQAGAERQRHEVSRACVPVGDGVIPAWGQDLLSRLSRVTDRAVRLRRLTASIEQGIAPPTEGDDVNPYAVLDTVPLRRWRHRDGEPMWEWQLLRVAKVTIPMNMFDPDASVTLPAADTGITLWPQTSSLPLTTVADTRMDTTAAEPATEPTVLPVTPIEVELPDTSGTDPVTGPATLEPARIELESADEPTEVVLEVTPVDPVDEPPVTKLEATTAPVVEEDAVVEQVVVETVVGKPVVAEPVVAEPVVTEQVVVEVERPVIPPAPRAPVGTVSSYALEQAREAFEAYNREQAGGRLSAVFYHLGSNEVHVTATLPAPNGTVTYVVLIVRPDAYGAWRVTDLATPAA